MSFVRMLFYLGIRRCDCDNAHYSFPSATSVPPLPAPIKIGNHARIMLKKYYNLAFSKGPLRSIVTVLHPNPQSVRFNLSGR